MYTNGLKLISLYDNPQYIKSQTTTSATQNPMMKSSKSFRIWNETNG